MWFDWMGAVSRKNGNIPGLSPLEDRIKQDSEYDIIKFITNNDFVEYVKFLKNNNTEKFEKRRFLVKKFLLWSFACGIIIDLIVWLLAIAFKDSSLGTIFIWIAIGFFVGTMLYYFLYINFGIISYYKKIYTKYHKYFKVLLNNNCITSDINMYPTSLKMSLVRKDVYIQEYADRNFPQFQYVSATWALCIFIDKLNTISTLPKINKN